MVNDPEDQCNWDKSSLSSTTAPAVVYDPGLKSGVSSFQANRRLATTWFSTSEAQILYAH